MSGHHSWKEIKNLSKKKLGEKRDAEIKAKIRDKLDDKILKFKDEE